MSRVHKRVSKLVNFEGYLQIKLMIKDFKNHFFLLLGLVLNDFHKKTQCAIFVVGPIEFRQCDPISMFTKPTDLLKNCLNVPVFSSIK